jgi:hypothetical protein
MPVQSAKRGAIPANRHALAAAKPYSAVPVAAPPTYIVIPRQLSFWGNYNYGDCVTAEEAFAKACNNPEVFVPEDDAIAWATRHGVLNGAQLTTVMTWMQTDGFPVGTVTYDDGSYSAVDWTNAATLRSAISQGPVKLCIAGDQLDATWQSTDGQSGWFATGYHEDTNYDHCTALCGYGSISWLAGQLGVNVPAGIDGTQPGYAMFTWDSIGIIDVPSMIAITAEAWLRLPTTLRRAETRDLFVSVYNNQQHFTYLDANGNLQDCWYGGGWNLQQINNANGSGATVAGESIAASQATAAAAGGMFVCQFNDQDHFAYLDVNGNIQDCWYDGTDNKWNLQQINRGTGPTVAGEAVMTNGPAVAGDLFVSVYNNQQHFTYRDARGNIQDCWYNGASGKWSLQQINDANGSGATVAGEFIATPHATAAAAGGLFVCQYNDQDHFAYLDANGNIQDCWYNGPTNTWNLQQINGTSPTVAGEPVMTDGPAVAGDLFVTVYDGQQHFTYRDAKGNIQDCWYGGGWHLQQINAGSGATVPGEFVATAQATAAAVGGLFVCQYNNQDHFAYLDANGHIQDCWYDGSWNLQQINGTSPTVAGEPVMTDGPAVAGDLFVTVYDNQQHFTYRDAKGNIQDCWYNGASGRWNLQQINDANGSGATVAGEYIATTQATAAATE